MVDNTGVTWPGWRSLMFVPAVNRHMVDTAASRGADALILDLEDAVATDQKEAARLAVHDALPRLVAAGAKVLVRVNSGMLAMLHDIEACVLPGLVALVVPKAEQPARLALVGELLGDLEQARGLPLGSIGIIPLIESAQGLLAAAALASVSPRVMAIALGPEDLALDLGTQPVTEVLLPAATRLQWAAKAAGCAALGFPGPISNITDAKRLEHDLSLARQLGFDAALCVHPAQLPFCHEAFTPTADEAEQALRIMTVYQRALAAGEGVCLLDGQMVDRPVVLRAEATLKRWQQHTN